jgi:hypothetical protein
MISHDIHTYLMRFCTITVQTGAVPNRLDMAEVYNLPSSIFTSILHSMFSVSRSQNPILGCNHEGIHVSRSSFNAHFQENYDSCRQTEYFWQIKLPAGWVLLATSAYVLIQSYCCYKPILLYTDISWANNGAISHSCKVFTIARAILTWTEFLTTGTGRYAIKRHTLIYQHSKSWQLENKQAFSSTN